LIQYEPQHLFWWKAGIVILIIDLIKRAIQYGAYEIRWLKNMFHFKQPSITHEQMHTCNNMLTVVMSAVELGDKDDAKLHIRKLKDYLTSLTER
jgi:hypothetical protein